jgi:peptidoglycan/xylan/chitin deacetylase (PgdA/CDA1 family)
MSRLAFHEDAANRSMALAWLGDALRWCSGVAGADLAPWPEGAEAAVLLAEDTEDRFENAASFLEALDRRGLPGTFLCVSDLARHHPQLMRRIAERHEVGSHGDDHRELEGLPLEEQKRHVTASARVLSDLTGRPVLGFRPPGEGFDQATLEALAGAGYRYLLAGGHARALPEVLAVEAPGRGSIPIVRIGRTAPDDYDVVITRKVSPEGAVLELERGLERVRVFEGVDLVSVHTQILGRPETIGALELFLDGLRHQRVWVTTGGNLAAWWLQRSACETTIELAEDGAFHLRVANTGEEELSKLLVRFCLPANPARVTYRLLGSSSSPFMSGPVGTSVQLEPDWRGTFTLALHPVPAHSEIVYEIQISDPRAQNSNLALVIPKADTRTRRAIARRRDANPRDTNPSRLSTWHWTCSRLPAGVAERFDPEIPKPLNAGMAGRFDDHGPGLNLLVPSLESATELESELR